MIGVKKFLTGSLSVRRESTKTTEIGRMSAGILGEGILGIGWITAVFHCDGTEENMRDILMRYVKGFDIKGAASLKNQKGRSSGPDAVGLRWSTRKKTENSKIGLARWVAVDLG